MIGELDSMIDTIFIESNFKLEEINLSAQEALDNIGFTWGQKLFLQKFRKKMNSRFSRESTIIIFSELAKNTKDIIISDALFQQLEDEEKNYQRMI